MTYEEAIQETLSSKRAAREIAAHCLEWSDFIAEVGDKPQYTGKEVLDWLGY